MAFGLPIKIEYKVGDTRKGRGPNGPWSYVMKTAYGHVKKTEGMDGEELDVYVGTDTKSQKVFAITQLKGPAWKEVDEQKFMVGFPDAKSAKAAYLENYPDPKIFGGMKTMTLEDFKTKAGNPELAGKKIARLVEINLGLLGQGEKIAGIQVMGGAQAQALSAQLAAERGVSSPYIADIGGPGNAAPTERSFPRLPMTIRSRNGSGATYKVAELDARTSRIADRIDDVGIATLAAPYAVKGLAKMQHRRGVAGAAGRWAARATGEHGFFHKHEVPMELAGLAMVAPGVVHPAAKVVSKVVPKKPLPPEKVAKLEKIAHALFPDYEYLTEPEKVAFLSGMAGLAGRASGAITRAGVGAKNVAQTLKHKATTGLASIQANRQYAFARGKALGQGASDSAARAHGMAAARPAHTVARSPAPAKIQTPMSNKPPSQAGAGVKPPATAAGAAPAPATTVTPTPNAPSPAAAGVKPVGAATKPILSGRNMLMAGAAGAAGLATYAGYKGIQAAAGLAQHHPHIAPAPAPDFAPYGS